MIKPHLRRTRRGQAAPHKPKRFGIPPGLFCFSQWETLGSDYGLGTALKQSVSPATREPVSEYLTYNPLQTADYTSQLGGSYLSAYYNAYSKGLLLDLIA